MKRPSPWLVKMRSRCPVERRIARSGSPSPSMSPTPTPLAAGMLPPSKVSSDGTSTPSRLIRTRVGSGGRAGLITAPSPFRSTAEAPPAGRQSHRRVKATSASSMCPNSATRRRDGGAQASGAGGTAVSSVSPSPRVPCLPLDAVLVGGINGSGCAGNGSQDGEHVSTHAPPCACSTSAMTSPAVSTLAQKANMIPALPSPKR